MTVIYRYYDRWTAICNMCGSVVKDRELHDQWHSDLAVIGQAMSRHLRPVPSL